MLAIARVQTMMGAVALQTTIILGVATWLIWRGATGQSTEEGTIALLIAAVLTTPLLLGLFLPGIQRELERQIAAHRTDPPPANGNRRDR